MFHFIFLWGEKADLTLKMSFSSLDHSTIDFKFLMFYNLPFKNIQKKILVNQRKAEMTTLSLQKYI